MRRASNRLANTAEKTVRDIGRATRRLQSAEDEEPDRAVMAFTDMMVAPKPTRGRNPKIPHWRTCR